MASVGLLVPGRPVTPSDGRAQHYLRPGKPSKQKTRTFANGTTLTFGLDDPIDNFVSGDPFYEQYLVIKSATSDIMAVRDRYYGAGALGSTTSLMSQGIASQTLSPTIRGFLVRDEALNNYERAMGLVPSNANTAAVRGNHEKFTASVYQSFNRSNSPGLGHPGYSTDTRGPTGVPGFMTFDGRQVPGIRENNRGGAGRGAQRGVADGFAQNQSGGAVNGAFRSYIKPAHKSLANGTSDSPNNFALQGPANGLSNSYSNFALCGPAHHVAQGGYFNDQIIPAYNGSASGSSCGYDEFNDPRYGEVNNPANGYAGVPNNLAQGGPRGDSGFDNFHGPKPGNPYGPLAVAINRPINNLVRGCPPGVGNGTQYSAQQTQLYGPTQNVPQTQYGIQQGFRTGFNIAPQRNGVQSRNNDRGRSDNHRDRSNHRYQLQALGRIPQPTYQSAQLGANGGQSRAPLVANPHARPDAFSSELYLAQHNHHLARSALGPFGRPTSEEANANAREDARRRGLIPDVYPIQSREQLLQDNVLVIPSVDGYPQTIRINPIQVSDDGVTDCYGPSNPAHWATVIEANINEASGGKSVERRAAEKREKLEKKFTAGMVKTARSGDTFADPDFGKVVDHDRHNRFTSNATAVSLFFNENNVWPDPDLDDINYLGYNIEGVVSASQSSSPSRDLETSKEADSRKSSPGRPLKRVAYCIDGTERRFEFPARPQSAGWAPVGM